MSINILQEANDIISGEREGQYGKAEDSFARIAMLWNTYIEAKYGDQQFELSAEDVAHMMTLLKMARQMHSHKRDNFVDAIGYMALAHRIAEENTKEARQMHSHERDDAMDAAGYMTQAHRIAEENTK